MKQKNTNYYSLVVRLKSLSRVWKIDFDPSKLMNAYAERVETFDCISKQREEKKIKIYCFSVCVLFFFQRLVDYDCLFMF